MRGDERPGPEGRGDVTADRIKAKEGGLAAGIIYGGVHYGSDGPLPEPIRWQGPLAAAPASILGVAPLPADRREFATYVERDQDGQLRDMMTAEPFVIVRGPSLAGKSRSLYEAARALLPAATVIVPDADRPDALADLEHELPTDGEIVIWLDDLDRYVYSTGTRLSSGLTYQQLDAWLAPARHIHVLATIRVDAWHDVSRGYQALQTQPRRGDRHSTHRSDRTGWDVLKRGALLSLEGPASARELELAADTFDATVPEGLSFGEFLYSIPRLLDLLDTANPDEQAIVWAAADWRRMTGTPTIGRDRLREQWAAWLRALGQPALERRFEPALEFALASNSESWLALLTEAEEATFTIPDYFVAHREGGVDGGSSIEIPDGVWRAAMDGATPDTLVTIGLRAEAAGEDSLAREAWGRAFGTSGDDVPSANAGFLLGLVHLEARAFPEGIAIGTQLWAKFGKNMNPEVRAIVASGFVNLAETYSQSGDRATAITIGERLVVEFGEMSEPDIRASVAQGMSNLALHQAQAERLDDAIATGERLIAEFGDATDYDIRRSVANGLRNLAIDQVQAERLDVAIATGERLIAEFGDSWDEEIRESVARGMSDLAVHLAQAGRIDDAIAIGKRLVADFADEWWPVIDEVVADGMVNLAIDQARAEQLADAIATGEHLVTRFEDSEDPQIRGSVAKGMGNLAVDQAQAGRLDDAISTNQRLIALFGDAPEAEMHEAVARAMRMLVADQAQTGRLDEAISINHRLTAEFGDATEQTIRGHVAWGMHDLALAQADAGRLDDAVSTGQELVAQLGDAPNPATQEVVASALGNLALHHARRGDTAASIDTRDRLLSGLGEVADPAILEGVAGDLADLAEAYNARGVGYAAISTAEAIARLFGGSTQPWAVDAIRRSATYVG